ncbi:MAG: hypothetical protein SLAVMIC_00950 [uncultured marine phage]|uniref:Uncharacterized protein n=1 Tax=uncultured marine phage TaxID=707152 RepID=A0A8D9C9S8_9VIRU|nr:MAG: hypothetical protein SLAVMIC_00950 [uncultured marine phage]
MEKFSKIFEDNSEIQGKISELKSELDSIKDLEVAMNHKESGNGVIIKMELSFSGNLKKLSTEALISILGKLNGYIEGIEYEDRKNKMVILFKTFSHKI